MSQIANTNSLPVTSLDNVSETGGMAAQVALFAAQSAQDHRKAQRQGWENKMQLAEQAKDNMQAQANDIRDAAWARLGGAIANSVVTGAAAYVQIKSLNTARGQLELDPSSGSKDAAEGGQSAVDAQQKKMTAELEDGLTSQSAQAGRPGGQESAEKPRNTSTAEENLEADVAHGNGGAPNRESAFASDADRVSLAQHKNALAQYQVQTAAAWGMIGQSLGGLAQQSGNAQASMYDAASKDKAAFGKVIDAQAELVGEAARVNGEEASKGLDIASNAIQSIPQPKFG